ncbi:hypothetical protein G3R48_08855 [Shewanella intestini]|uniref:Uncharacterized protein n=1 Tax=Shewanella intestini TaxID=2017544 RepID=A0ABS5I458_9GAMM|nr:MULTISPECIES: hypothetical protein [Shewanella]MBR9728090.1 hypothetical protein [Shewanella intestini]
MLVAQGSFSTWTPTQINYVEGLSSSSEGMTLWSTDNEYWIGRFSSNHKTFVTSKEQGKLFKIVGYK